VDYITKPFDVQELRLRVRNVLRRSRMGQLCHPITGLSTALVSDEHLSKLLTRHDWAVLSVGLRGLGKFAETYGFVARDDVVRAVALMLSHVLNEGRDPNAYVGHLDDTNIVAIIASRRVKQVRQALMVRLNEAMAFFYPRADWEAGQVNPDAKLPRLDVKIGVLQSSEGSFSSLKELKQAIVKTQCAD
jgi:GGDEF domain-containing protein